MPQQFRFDRDELAPAVGRGNAAEVTKIAGAL